MTDPDPGTQAFGTGAFPDPDSVIVPDQSAAARPTEYPFLEPPIGADEIGWLDHYRVDRLLGAGGMGFVFAAEDTHLKRHVALKVMRPELAENVGFRQRFLEEARAAARLASDHIITVFQVGQSGDVPFLAMQYLHGEALQARLERDAPLPPNLAALIARQTAAGLADAHDAGLIHRDIKPANLWLEADRPGGVFRRVRILDFGLARPDDRDAKLTASGVIVGTPHYMAPEQAGGHDIDGRADLFSLGCVLYTMLTGELAFDGKTTMAVLMALASRIPPPVVAKNPLCPHPLSDLIARLLAKPPELRPASAAEVVQELDAVLTGLPNPLAGVRETKAVGWTAAARRPAAPVAWTPAPPTAFDIPADPVTPGRGSPLASRPTPPPADRPSGARAEATPPSAPPSPPPASAVTLPAPPPAGRDWRSVAVGSMALCCAMGVLFGVWGRFRGDPAPATGLNPASPTVAADPIPVGVLHSQSGTMAVSEGPVADATLLAIDDVNAAGGVLGRRLRAFPRDGKSDPAEFARAADHLAQDEKAAVLFGCWTSASRKAVRPVVERDNVLLVYPVQYEGLEDSPRVVYLGPSPNQQLFPAVDFLTDNLKKKRLFLVGSDYVFPRAAHEIVRDHLKHRPDVEIVGEAFLPLGAEDVSAAVAKVRAADPDAVLNTINGTTNFRFFRALRAGWKSSAEVPVMSVSVPETDVAADPEAMAGDYLAGCYFESVGGPEGQALLAKVRQRFGKGRTLSDPMCAAYAGVHLWARAVAEAKSLDAGKVAEAVGKVRVPSAFGELSVDPETLHARLPARIGQVTADGKVTVVAGSDRLIDPAPYPGTRRRGEWDRFLNRLFAGWNGHWQAPAASKP